MARACRLWPCRWLVGDTDFVILQATDDRSTGVPMVVIWVDSRHHDPALRDFLLRRTLKGLAGLVRFNLQGSIALFAPPMSADG